MISSVVADLLVLAHLTFIVFALVGGLLALRWRWMPWLHLPAACWGAAVAFFGWICPLTPIENAMRRQSGSAGYEGSFIDHYVVPVIYPTDLTREVQTLLAILMLVANLAIYLWVWRQLRAKRVGESLDD